MPRILLGCLTATALLLLGQQRAVAWYDGNFNTGLNTGYSAGGFNALWGLVQTHPGSGGQPGCNPWDPWNPCCPPECGTQWCPTPMNIPIQGARKGYLKPLLHPYIPRYHQQNNYAPPWFTN